MADEKMDTPNYIRRLSRLQLAFILLAFLIACSGFIWFVYSYFTIDNVTNPVQNFTDTRLGITLQYPNQWIEASDPGQSTIHFYDNSSHTTQIEIGMYSAGIAVEQFIQEQVSQLGMTNTQIEAPLSFAGTLWQQLEGHLVEKGADYEGGLFVTQHNHHLYMIAQFAPQGIYVSEEKLIFSPLRKTFYFL